MNSLYNRLINIATIIFYSVKGFLLWFVPKSLRYKNVRGEVVLITGAGGGIGRILAFKFSNLGCKVVIWDINNTNALETAYIIKKNGGEAYAYCCDVSESKHVYETAAKVKKDVGNVNILINNAGIITKKRFLQNSDDSIRRTFNVNTLSHFWTCKAFLPDMKKANHGHLVAIASMAGLCGTVKLSEYSASKFAAVGLEESIRLELHDEGYTGIHSTVVCPYFVNTDLLSDTRITGSISPLNPEYVADEIVSAILVNQELLMIPKIFYILMFLKSFVPTRATREVLKLLGILTAINVEEVQEPQEKQNGVDSKKNEFSIPTENGYKNILR